MAPTAAGHCGAPLKARKHHEYPVGSTTSAISPEHLHGIQRASGVVLADRYHSWPMVVMHDLPGSHSLASGGDQRHA